MIIDNLFKDKINRDKQSDKKDTKILKKGGQIMNKNLFKRVICLIIALMMVMPNMPMTAFANETALTENEAEQSQNQLIEDETQTEETTEEPADEGEPSVEDEPEEEQPPV